MPWPSMFTNPGGHQAQPASMLPASALIKPRKTLSDDDRKRMCRYHVENPAVKQAEIAGEHVFHHT